MLISPRHSTTELSGSKCSIVAVTMPVHCWIRCHGSASCRASTFSPSRPISAKNRVGQGCGLSSVTRASTVSRMSAGKCSYRVMRPTPPTPSPQHARPFLNQACVLETDQISVKPTINLCVRQCGVDSRRAGVAVGHKIVASSSPMRMNRRSLNEISCFDA
ncbi:hypothetical protein JQ559_15395 [Bradyrhizobium viridifuturi]|nr:hypothetical protein [Bradyrhizobium viridifuturi]MBR1045037.1 hypothetical protein [Bradyrhizobium viridifuturi]MBR1085651.1 hypothetical protein [Bradyrhizobium viridifuturi]MBR1096295.1 hypothetical protein [Bradyrhizobium viridifuturi]MBR1103377.1 hypothetical protein [Bradyrhizobium viridifuturi]